MIERLSRFPKYYVCICPAYAVCVTARAGLIIACMFIAHSCRSILSHMSALSQINDIPDVISWEFVFFQMFPVWWREKRECFLPVLALLILDRVTHSIISTCLNVVKTNEEHGNWACGTTFYLQLHIC